MGMRAWDCMTHRTRAFCAAPISSAKQTGIRQRSLRKHCRLGRATELVFITALGTAVMIGGGAAAQSVTYTKGQNRTDLVDTAGDVVLTVNGTDTATQSGVVSGAGTVDKQGTGTLTLSGANTYTKFTAVVSGTLDVTGSIASLLIGTNAGARLIVDGASVLDTAILDMRGTLELTGNETIGLLRGTGVVELGANTLTLSSGFGDFWGTISGTGGVTVAGGDHRFGGPSSFTGVTTINAGVLHIGLGGTTGSLGTGNVVNNATLTFNRSDDVTVANVISGTGGITESGTGSISRLLSQE